MGIIIGLWKFSKFYAHRLTPLSHWKISYQQNYTHYPQVIYKHIHNQKTNYPQEKCRIKLKSQQL